MKHNRSNWHGAMEFIKSMLWTIILSVIAFVCLVSVYAIFVDIPKSIVMRFAYVGSGFGIVSGITAIIAVCLLWITYNLHRDEVSKVIEHSEDQKAWSYVSQMCKFYRDMMSEVVYNSRISLVFEYENLSAVSDSVPKGTDGLRALILELVHRTRDLADDNWQNHSIEDQANLFLEDAEGCLVPFHGPFRMLYRIFKYIDDIKDYEKKQQLSRIPRSILSNVELEAIFINALTKEGQKMKDYVEKYKILDNYKPEILLEYEDEKPPECRGDLHSNLRGRYEPSAFGRD